MGLVHVDLIGPYSKSIIQHQTGSTFICNNASLTCMKMIDPDTGWFEIVKIQTFDLDKVAKGNDEYIDKSSDRVSHQFNNIFLCRYPCPRKVVFDKGSEFK